MKKLVIAAMFIAAPMQADAMTAAQAKPKILASLKENRLVRAAIAYEKNPGGAQAGSPTEKAEWNCTISVDEVSASSDSYFGFSASVVCNGQKPTGDEEMPFVESSFQVSVSGFYASSADAGQSGALTIDKIEFMRAG
jgi:hypothetical protein